jgi:hypothetical protein
MPFSDNVLVDSNRYTLTDFIVWPPERDFGRARESFQASIVTL